MSILTIILVCIAILFIAYLVGKNRPSQDRSTIEKLACTLFGIFNRKVERATESIRTASVVKEEALSEIDNALRNLEKSYKDSQFEMRKALKSLETEILPSLKDQPGILNSKAKMSKDKYQKSVDEGTPIAAYKQNAIKALQAKSKAVANIAKVEENIKKLKVNIETAQAEYTGNKMDLDIMRTDLMAMTEIPQITLNESLNRINSLKNELDNKVRDAQVRQDIESEMRNEQYVDSNFESEFNNL